LFNRVGVVIANQNHFTSNSYKLTDLLSIQNTPTYFYRLKMIDKNNRYTFSSLVKVSFDRKEGLISIAPNPFKDNLVLNINSAEKKDALVLISSVDGKMLISKKYKLVEGNNNLRLMEAKELSKGAYLLTIIVGNDKKTYNIEKQ